MLECKVLKWYLIITGIIYFITLFDGVVKTKIRAKKNLSLFLALSVLLFFMAFRSFYTGVDTIIYVNAFDQIKNYSMIDALKKPIFGLGNYTIGLEPGYRLFNWVSGIISKNNQTIIVTVSTFIITIVYAIIIRKSPYPLLSVWMYLTLGIYQTEMNISRNAIALMLCFLTDDLIYEKKLIKFILVILLASSFHASAFLFIPVYFLVNYVPIGKRTIKWMLVIAVVSMLLLPFVRSTIVIILPFYQRYFMSNKRDYASLVVGLFYYMLFIVVLFFVKKNDRHLILKEEAFGTWMFLLNTMIFIVGINMTNAARAAAIFGPYIIVYLPRLINRGITGNKRFWVRVALYFLCVAQYISRMFINNIGGTMPYMFTWNM